MNLNIKKIYTRLSKTEEDTYLEDISGFWLIVLERNLAEEACSVYSESCCIELVCARHLQAHVEEKQMELFPSVNEKIWKIICIYSEIYGSCGYK